MAAGWRRAGSRGYAAPVAGRRQKGYRLPKDSRSQGAGRWILAGLLVVLVCGAVVWLLLESGSPAPDAAFPPSVVAPVVESLPPAPTQPPAPPPVVQVSTNLLKVPPPPPATPAARMPPAETPSEAPPRLLPGPVGAPWVPRPVTNLLEAQIALVAQGISGGSIDGVAGAQSAAAIRAFQLKSGLEQTGRLDRETIRALRLDRAPFATFVVTPAHRERLVRIPPTWLGKSGMESLDYESILELVAESAHAHPSLVRRMNPGIDWAAATPGTAVAVPDARFPPARRIARIRIGLAGRQLRAFDEHGGLVAHFPCSIGRIAEKRPVGSLHVAVVAKDPNYTFDPAVFPESAEARTLRRRLVLPPGPNNPVGVAWIGLDRPGYGIHGTPAPEQVGRTESHGCFRLANWDADYLRQMAWVGLPVSVEP